MSYFQTLPVKTPSMKYRSPLKEMKSYVMLKIMPGAIRVGGFTPS